MSREPLAEDDRESLRSWAGVNLLASRVVLAPRRISPERELQPRPRSATSAAGVEQKEEQPLFCADAQPQACADSRNA